MPIPKIEQLPAPKTAVTVPPTPEDGRALGAVVTVTVNESALVAFKPGDRLSCRVADAVTGRYQVVTDWDGLAFLSVVVEVGKQRIRVETPGGPAILRRSAFSLLDVESRTPRYGRSVFRVPSPFDVAQQRIARMLRKRPAPDAPTRIYSC